MSKSQVQFKVQGGQVVHKLLLRYGYICLLILNVKTNGNMHVVIMHDHVSRIPSLS